jgi:hypothetical protein
MVKTNTSQIITMVAIFAVLIGLIIFMRRNDEKEGFSAKKRGGCAGAEGGEGCGEGEGIAMRRAAAKKRRRHDEEV